MDLERHFVATLRALLGTDFHARSYLIGVSGGMDSAVLLHLTRKAIASSQLTIAHFNHALRGVESEADQKFVQKLAASHGIRFVTGRGQGAKKSEAALREERHRFFRIAQVESGADYILLAHQADDQLETFLMRIIRGTGVSGLRGILPVNGVLVRPLLEVPREEIERYAGEFGVLHRRDESNSSPQYLRNRLRHGTVRQILEEAKPFGGNTAFFQRFGALIREHRENEKRIERLDLESARDLFVRTAFWTRCSAEHWRRLGPMVQARLLRQCYQNLSLELPSRRDLLRALRRLEEKAKASDLPNGLHLQYSCEQFFFQSNAQRALLLREKRLSPTTAGWWCEALKNHFVLKGPETGELRFFRPGDTDAGRKKLKELFLERRIPRWERELIPLYFNAAGHVTFYPFTPRIVEIEGPTFPFSFLP